MNIKLSMLWLHLAKYYTDDEKLINKLHEQIVECHSESHRHYHTLTHLSAIFEDLESLMLDQSSPSTHCIHFAVWFHDIVYKPGSTVNEKESAKFAETALSALGVPVEMIEQVTYMIECTEQHNNPKQDVNTQLFLDADMAIIGVSGDAYRSYTEKIKEEFASMPDILFQQGRKRFIEVTLNAQRIFQTDYFFSRYEKQARINLCNELACMCG
jgi:predicted metal-dependent HD superfamily phosphohydrolase